MLFETRRKVTMKSHFPFKIIFAKSREKPGRLSWWGINIRSGGKKVDNASHQITIQHCSSAKLLLHIFQEHFFSTNGFWESRGKKLFSRHTREEITIAGIDVCKTAKKLYVQRERAGKRDMCVWKAISFKRRALVHPYVFKIAKFSSIRQTIPIFFREFVMGASQTIECRSQRQLIMDFKRRVPTSLISRLWGELESLDGHRKK